MAMEFIQQVTHTPGPKTRTVLILREVGIDQRAAFIEDDTDIFEKL